MVKEIRNFLSEIECDKIILESVNHLERTTTLGEEIENYRVANGVFINDENELSRSIKNSLKDLIFLNPERSENLHVVQYNVGGEYKDHHDFFHENESYFEDEIKRGGQRILTALIYLNDDFEGGETNFPNYGLTVKPEKGKLLLWTNINEDLTPNFDSLHAGLPVTKGVKYIAVIWYRENNFY